MPWPKFRGRKKETQHKETQPKETSKPTIYFATRDGITDGGTGGGLFNYVAGLMDGRRSVAMDTLDEMKKKGYGLKIISDFSYEPSIGLMFQAESIEDAKNKLLEQKNNIITGSDLDKFEEKLIEEQKSKAEEKKAKTEEKIDLEKYRIPEELKKKLAGKTGIEVKSGINLDYEKAIKGLHEWRRFES